jgi:hypothetical protein
MSDNADSLTARLEADRQRVMSECPGYLVWWLYSSNARVTWHARPEGVRVCIPLSADSADELIQKVPR